jgi:Tol biopolymer transport system component
MPRHLAHPARPTRHPLLALLLSAAACGDPAGVATRAGSPTLDAADAPGGPVARPTLFEPGVISTEREEYRVSFTPSGDTVYFTRGDLFFPISQQATIYYSTFERGRWTEPRVAPFSGTYADIDPFVSPDGQRLYFSSIRPVDGVQRADADLWMVERIASGWSEPVHLGNLVNTPYDELYPSVSSDGTIYFGSPRPGGFGGWDVWSSTPQDGVYGAAVNVGPGVNSPVWDFNPVVSEDGTTLFFTSLNRPGGYGLGDIYVSRLAEGAWAPAVNLGPVVNTAADEYHPALSPKEKTLYFIRHTYAPWVPGDVYRVPLRATEAW